MLSACDQEVNQYHCEQHPSSSSIHCFEGSQYACKSNRRLAERCHHHPFQSHALILLRCHASNAIRC